MPKQSLATRLTKTVVDSTACPVTGQTIVRDDDLKGFGLLVSAGGTKSFFVQRDLHRKGKRVTVRSSIGKYGLITCEEARKRATVLLGKLADGIDPRMPTAAGITLRQAWAGTDKFVGWSSVPRSANTQRRYGLILRKYFVSWLDRPLASIDEQDVLRRHAELQREVAAGTHASPDVKHVVKSRNGECTANDALRFLRALWNGTKRQLKDLPPNPCGVMDKRWFRTERPRTVVPVDDLAAWWNGTATITNPTRRDYLRLALLTGLRRASAAEIAWNDVDLERGSLRIPRPKGGAEKAFTLPLSDYMIEMLRARRIENGELADKGWLPTGSPWVFPAWGASGHLSEPREDVGVKYSTHALRRTYSTIAESLDISPYAIKTLINHSQPKSDVTGGYLNLSVERLRVAQQRITDEILRLVGERRPADVIPFDRRQVAA